MSDFPAATSRSASANPGAADPPSRLRRVAMYALLGVLVGGSIVAIVRDDKSGRELWPFSAFPMYSNRPGWISRSHRVFGVLREDPTREIPLIADEYLYPIEHSRFYMAIRRMEESGRDRDQALAAALRETLERYEANRKAGRHHGPALRAVRLYELQYRLDPWARNRDRADERRLLAEVAAP